MGKSCFCVARIDVDAFSLVIKEYVCMLTGKALIIIIEGFLLAVNMRFYGDRKFFA